MDKEQVLKSIQVNIRDGKDQLASTQIMELANYFSDDVFTLLTCSSLLKTIGDDKGSSDIVERILKAVGTNNRVEVSKGFRSIGYPKAAREVLSNTEENDEVIRGMMGASFDLRDHSEVQRLYEKLEIPTITDSIMMVESLSASKEHSKAEAIATGLLKEASDDVNVQKCYCSVLVAGGRNKDAEKFVKDNLKKNKASPDANALAAYYLWIEGKTTSAGAYATKAVKADPKHIMAMEILAYCLVDKGKVNEAKIVAGAINESDPGNPAVVRILDMCKTVN